VPSSTLITATGAPKATVDRTLEDLVLLHLVKRTKSGEHDNSPWQYELVSASGCSSEMSVNGDSLRTRTHVQQQIGGANGDVVDTDDHEQRHPELF
jgi:hypothetical protein